MILTSHGLRHRADSEFADYHRGAYAYRQGPTHYDEAKKAWLALLNRPANERHYRTLWATFMLGKLATKAGDQDGAKWFQKTRELTKQGFADSLGMASDSYGWEGRAEWKQGHLRQNRMDLSEMVHFIISDSFGAGGVTIFRI
jgi:hypothetical protein